MAGYASQLSKARAQAQAQRATQVATRAAEQARVNAIAKRGAANGNPGLQANLTAQPGQSVTGASAPPGPSAPPIDPAFEAYRAAAGRNVSLSDAEARYQTGRLSNEYGIGDTSNPYSKAALLQESYNRSKLGTTNSMAAQGQLYSGSLVNAQNENDRNFSINSDALRRAYEAASHNVRFGQAQTYANNAIGVDTEGFNALLRGLGA